MSQTRNHTEDDSNNPGRAQAALSRMVKQGRSFSGNERNCCFLNMGGKPGAGGRFATVSAVSGIDFPDDGRAVAPVDWDHDGDLDLWITNRGAPRLRFLNNDTPSENHFVAFWLVGDGLSTPRDAIGARVELMTSNAGGKKRIKTLRAGEGFLAQSSRWVHFGLGPTDRVDQVTVRWPGGQVQSFSEVDLDQHYHLVQGVPKAKGWSRPQPTKPGSVTQRSETVGELPRQAGSARIPLITLLPVPKLHYEALDLAPAVSPRRPLRLGEGTPLLINLWASWCPPCIAELKEFTQRESELRAAGIEVVALAVDGLGDDRSNPARAKEMVSKLNFPFTAGRATSELIQVLQGLHDVQMSMHRPLQIPSSFLVDAAGRLQVIYKGKLSTDDLIADVSHSRGTRLERTARAAPLTGRVLRHERLRAAADRAEMRVRLQFARDLQQVGRLEDAVAQYLEVLELQPNLFEAENALGTALLDLGDFEAAQFHFERTLRLRPDHAEARYNLGVVLQSRGQPGKAAAQFERAIELRSDFAAAHHSLGVLFLTSGKVDQAARQFAQVIRIRPDDAHAHNNLGLALRAQNHVKEAIAHFSEAVRVDPDNLEAHNNLGAELLAQRQYDAAERHYNAVLRLAPESAEAHYNLGNVYEKRGELTRAAAAFERALSAGPDAVAYAGRLGGQPTHAQVTRVSARFNLGVVLVRMGNLEEAAAQFERVLDIQPDDAGAKSMLERLRVALKEK